MFDLLEYVAWFKKHIKGRDLFLYAAISLLFFVTRLINLDKFPIFTDEGIYIRWARIAWHDATWRFISLTDGRQPLQTWATIPLLKLFPDNMLFAGRLFGVLSGFAALLGLIVLTYYLFGKKASLIRRGFSFFVSLFFFFSLRHTRWVVFFFFEKSKKTPPRQGKKKKKKGVHKKKKPPR